MCDNVSGFIFHVIRRPSIVILGDSGIKFVALFEYFLLLRETNPKIYLNDSKLPLKLYGVSIQSRVKIT